VAIYGNPISVESNLNNQELGKKLQEVQEYMIELDQKADSFFG
jgi:hypothetical protein